MGMKGFIRFFWKVSLEVEDDIIRGDSKKVGVVLGCGAAVADSSDDIMGDRGTP